MTKKLRLRLNLLILALLPQIAWALPSDFEQPIDIEADQVTIDADSQSSIYSGNVRLTRGSIRIEANKLVISQNSKTGAVSATITGKPATYSQRQNNGTVSAKANKLTYSSNEDIIELSGNAILDRAGSTIENDSIRYNTRDNTISAGGNSASDKPVKIRILPGATRTTE